MWSDAMAPERQREAERNSPERSECTSGLGAPRTSSGRVTPTQRPMEGDRDGSRQQDGTVDSLPTQRDNPRRQSIPT